MRDMLGMRGNNFNSSLVPSTVNTTPENTQTADSFGRALVNATTKATQTAFASRVTRIPLQLRINASKQGPGGADLYRQETDANQRDYNTEAEANAYINTAQGVAERLSQQLALAQEATRQLAEQAAIARENRLAETLDSAQAQVTDVTLPPVSAFPTRAFGFVKDNKWWFIGGGVALGAWLFLRR